MMKLFCCSFLPPDSSVIESLLVCSIAGELLRTSSVWGGARDEEAVILDFHMLRPFLHLVSHAFASAGTQLTTLSLSIED